MAGSASQKKKNQCIFSSQHRAGQMPGPPRKGQLMFILFLISTSPYVVWARKRLRSLCSNRGSLMRCQTLSTKPELSQCALPQDAVCAAFEQDIERPAHDVRSICWHQQ